MFNWGLPKVSVIIATYNWSQALQLSIKSALQQTIREIEVIVVGDACTDDSKAVTQAIKDKRVRWIGLTTNSGSQAVPNNTGIAAANSDLIAYHGHDDIWHPNHLEWLIDTLEATQADYVYSGAILYGPIDTDIRMATGFPFGHSKKIHFAIPPTTAMHKKNLIDLIGPWKMNHESNFPIDYDLQYRAQQAGVKFANTGKISAFKFPAAWERDSYRKKDVSRQKALLAKMRNNPYFLEDELLAVVKAADHGMFIQSQLPSPLEKGEFFEINATLKGSRRAQNASHAPLETNYLLDKPYYYGFEWHGLEYTACGLPFRWSGPRCESSLDIPIATHQDIAINIHVLQSIVPEILRDLCLFANNQPILFTINNHAHMGHQLTATVPKMIANALAQNILKLTFKIPKTIAPLEIDDNSDKRLIGLAIHAIKCVSLENISQAI